MNIGMIKPMVALCVCLIMTDSAFSAEIYKVVDKDGNVTFTDQPPGDGAKPMDLPPLSIIETDIQVDKAPAEGDSASADEASKEPTWRELQRIYSDFRITQPQNGETFWGTANKVTVSWTSSTPPAADMKVQVLVDGQVQAAPAVGGLALTLDRGEHQVFAELRDARNRRIVTAETVTFYVQQNTVNRIR